MVSHIELSYEDEEKLIEYTKKSFSDSELRSICRSLNLDKDDVFSKNNTKKQDCESLIDAVKQHDYVNNLFFLLQSNKYYRERLITEFEHLNLKGPESDTKIDKLTKIVHDKTPSISRKNYETWINQCKKKMVLILGKDSPNEYMDELIKIAEVVEKQGYEPILIKHQEDVVFNTNEEKMLAYAAISRFIIIEKSYAAGQIDEAKICAINRFPCVWIQKNGMGDTWMQGDYEFDFKNINVITYEDSQIEAALNKGIEWAERFIMEKTSFLNAKYPWRSNV
ncbi:hypothetical protein ABEI56_05000 [Peribacillus castrilensis]|uniref:hypothetical protein n=1 Tax=Peribacillus TaxID=2675229 RepID=UPI0038724FB7